MDIDVYFRMKKLIINENAYNKIKELVKESYCDKVDLLKRYLDKNFMRATFEKDGQTVGIFVKTSNGIPTDKSYWRQDVLDILERDFNKILPTKKERDSLLSQVLNDWYNKKISKYGSLSSYSY